MYIFEECINRMYTEVDDLLLFCNVTDIAWLEGNALL